MNGSVIVLFSFIFFESCFLLVQCNGPSLRRLIQDYDGPNTEYLFGRNKTNEVLSSVYKTANKFSCQCQNIDNPELILYGTKSWVFPEQNINLTLKFPSDNVAKDIDKKYIITGFNVLLFMDNTYIKGFLESGGLLEDSISLTFTCNDVTMLLYEFWLFGVPADGQVWTNLVQNKENLPDTNDICFGGRLD